MDDLSRSIKPTARITTARTSISFMRGTGMRSKTRIKTTTRDKRVTQGTTSTSDMLRPISRRKRGTIIIMSWRRRNLISGLKNTRSRE